MGKIVDITGAADVSLAGQRVLIACAMMEDEVACAVEHAQEDVLTLWVDRGFHSEPDKLRRELQRNVDWVEERGATRILLAFGLCGNGAVGIVAKSAQLAIPRFDHCVNIMLECGPRTCQGRAQGGVMYLTRGWTHDAAAAMYSLKDQYVAKYGERRAKRLMEAMYGGYHAVSLIDNGCYELVDVMDVAQRSADSINVGVQIDPGSNQVLEKLISGPWDDDIVVCEPGRPLAQEDFFFDCEMRGNCSKQVLGY